MDAEDIILVLSIAPILRMLTAPLFAHIGDHVGKRRVICIMCLITLSAPIVLDARANYWPILLLTA
jgi:MFS family permease